MSTLGVFSIVGYSNKKDFPPMVLNTLHGTHDIPHVHHDIPMVLNTPTVLKITPTVLMITPMVLNTPRYSRYLHVYHDIRHGTEHPMVLKISPTVLMVSPMVLNTPTVLSTTTVLNTPHGAAHTLYRVDTQQKTVKLYLSWFRCCIMNQLFMNHQLSKGV